MMTQTRQGIMSRQSISASFAGEREDQIHPGWNFIEIYAFVMFWNSLDRQVEDNLILTYFFPQYQAKK